MSNAENLDNSEYTKYSKKNNFFSFFSAPAKKKKRKKWYAPPFFDYKPPNPLKLLHINISLIYQRKWYKSDTPDYTFYNLLKSLQKKKSVVTFKNANLNTFRPISHKSF